ncbi:SusC/RagA family TonB-linked outer membrane protein [Sphingobacterium sp. HJSM2_6]|uniref:SusC/RagA family TonB-linked outer membrane protein n=1 Tax=Sphingobacterium sp. HJSM2_6 TaxID=3366264 RepID=UPI003BBB02D3
MLIIQLAFVLPLYAQQITLAEKNSSVLQIVEKVSKQMKSDLVGDLSLLKNTSPISIQVTNMPVEELLAVLEKDQPINLRYKNNTIIISSKKNLEQVIPHVVKQDQIVLQGRVVNTNGQALAGVSVFLDEPNKSLGQTSKDGEFTIKINLKSKITFKMLGFEPKTIAVDGQNDLIIVLIQENQMIEETVVTGYSTYRKENFTGAAVIITRKDIEKFNAGNIFSMIQALDPSFKVDERVKEGSNPNALPEINIRGISSVGDYAVNAPLVILDGFEVSLSTLYDLDVNRIESISILKDASSTSLYGSRGGNGVIVIETRLPKDGRFTITYDNRPSMSIVDLSDYNLMDASEKLEYERLAGKYISQSEIFEYEQMENEVFGNLYNKRLRDVNSGVNSYWLKLPIQNTLTVNNSLRMEGGRDDVRYSLEGNYHNYKGVMKESGRIRGGAGFNLIYRIPKIITFRNIASYQYTKSYESPYGSFYDYTILNPYEKIYDDRGKYIVKFSELGKFYNFGDIDLFNPLYNAQLGFKDQNVSHSINNNLSLEWTIKPYLILRSKAGLSRIITTTDTYKSPFHTDFIKEKDPNRKGSYGFGNSTSMGYEGRLDLQFSNTFNKHQITANLVSEIRSSEVSGNSHVVTGYADDRFISPQMALGYKINSLPLSISKPVREIGFLGTFFYTYDNRYNLSFTGRSDGASIYGKENRFSNFWSTGVSYNMHNEKWFHKSFISRFRVFANVGTNSTVNNMNAGMVSTSFSFLSGIYYHNQYAAVYSGQGNPKMRWPEQLQTSMGLDITLLDNLFNLNASLYERTTAKMISPITVASSFGFSGNGYFQNLGKARNRGFELMANVRLYQDQQKDFTWFMNVGAVQNRSKLLEISNELRKLNESNVTKVDGKIISPSVYYMEGQSLSIIRSVPSLGIDPANGQEMFLHQDGSVSYLWDAKNQIVVGNQEPDLYGSLGTNINYKGFSVQLNAVYSIGGDIFNQTLIDKIENNNPYFNADRRVLEQRWKQPGDVAKYKSISVETITQASSRFVQVENFWRLASININYNFPLSYLQKYKLQRLKLNFSMNDPLRISSVRMERGLSYPYAREYNFGLMIQY